MQAIPSLSSVASPFPYYFPFRFTIPFTFSIHLVPRYMQILFPSNSLFPSFHMVHPSDPILFAVFLFVPPVIHLLDMSPYLYPIFSFTVFWIPFTVSEYHFQNTIYYFFPFPISTLNLLFPISLSYFLFLFSLYPFPISFLFPFPDFPFSLP